MIIIISMACIACSIESFVAKWEFWVVPLLIIGVVSVWWLHIYQKAEQNVRFAIYFVFVALAAFFHGIHKIIFFDISVVFLLFLAIFSIIDNLKILNLILIEYICVMAIQFSYLINSGQIDIDPITLVRIAFHVGVVFCMSLLCRSIVKGRISEQDKQYRWQESIRENNLDMEDFLANISHELRTPVNVVNGMSMLMLKNSDSEELTSIKEAGIRLAYQIEDIQDYTEIKRGELVLQEEKYMCISLINDVVSYYKAAGRDKALELIVDLAPDTPNMLKGDISKLHKLFRHIIDNSVKFTVRGGVYIRVFSIPREYGVNLIIEVTDTGVGMTRNDMALVSKGMYQANKKRNRSTGGIGIGLPIVYGFVHKMGGFVNINSKRGKGTTIRLSIPQAIVDHSPCLSVKSGSNRGVVVYMKPEKFKVPEIRDYYREMAVNLATGIKVKFYSARERRELEHLINDLSISHIFTEQEEYEEDRDKLDHLSSQGYTVVVVADDGFRASPGSGVIVISKPLYAFPIVRILNGESVDRENGREEKEKLDLSGVNALVVDDEPMNLVVATGLFRDYGMNVETAESGLESIKKYENGSHDIIFMDHMMPGMDGVEAMKHIRQSAEKNGRRPAIVALTANALSGAKEMFIKEGFDGFIAKPIDIGEFERVLRRVLPGRIVKNKREGGSGS